MAFRQVKELLQWVYNFHESLGAKYSRLANEQPDERMKLTLEFLADREQRMQLAMGRYLEHTDNEILNNWMSGTPEFVHPSMLERIAQCPDCRDIEDILANAITAHRILKDMYQVRSQTAQFPSEAELFADLTKHQDAEMRLQARDIGRMEMY